MTLNSILDKITYKLIKGDVSVKITSLCMDSRKVESGSVFVCIKGAASDGHRFIADVISKGAAAVIIQDMSYIDCFGDYTGTVLYVENTRKDLAYMAEAFYGYPLNNLKTIGITGTKGKTTTSYMVKDVLETCGFKVGLIGTIETIIGDKHIKAKNTTPDSLELQKIFREMVDKGIEIVIMEVSSQALMLDRTIAINFDVGVFTNLGKDHIGKNEHKDFEDYLSCKAKLFKQCKVGIGNVDDKYFEEIFKESTCKVKTFGLGEKADIRGLDEKLISGNGILGISFDVCIEDKKYPVEVDLPGRFSIYNALSAIAICKEFDVDFETIEVALRNVKVKGRVEKIKVSDDFVLMIDYAHNAMALESLLTTLKEYNPKRIVTLFGCGGDRSKDRRFEMGEVSGVLSDFTIITSDNPRTEAPMQIIRDIITGIEKTDGKYIAIENRIEAIKYAIDNAKAGDIIILAGKGHEDYQEINGVKNHLDEREVVRDIAYF